MWYRSSKAPVGMKLCLWLYEFLNSALDGMQWLNLRPRCFTPSDNILRHPMNRSFVWASVPVPTLGTVQEKSLFISYNKTN